MLLVRLSATEHALAEGSADYAFLEMEKMPTYDSTVSQLHNLVMHKALQWNQVVKPYASI